MAREKDDLDQYKRDQDMFFKEMEEREKDANVKKWLYDLQKRGGKIEELPKLHALAVKFAHTHLNLPEALATNRATLAVAQMLDMEPDDINKVLSATKSSRRTRRR